MGKATVVSTPGREKLQFHESGKVHDGILTSRFRLDAKSWGTSKGAALGGGGEGRYRRNGQDKDSRGKFHVGRL